MKGKLPLGLILLATLITTSRGQVPNVEWRRTGADGGNTRYSPLDQINAGNVRNLQIAWVWHSDNFGSQPEIKNETTPIMVGGDLIVAIDGQDVQDQQQLEQVMNNHRAGDTVRITIYRGKRRMDLNLTLGEAREQV